MSDYSRGELFDAMSKRLDAADLRVLRNYLSDYAELADMRSRPLPNNLERGVDQTLDFCDRHRSLAILVAVLNRRFPHVLRDEASKTSLPSIETVRPTSNSSLQNDVDGTQNNVAGTQSNVGRDQSNAGRDTIMAQNVEIYNYPSSNPLSVAPTIPYSHETENSTSTSSSSESGLLPTSSPARMIEIKPISIRSCLYFLKQFIFAPHELKIYIDGLCVEDKLRLNRLWAWMVSSLVWLPLLGLNIYTNFQPSFVSAIIGQHDLLEILAENWGWLPFVLVGCWIVSAVRDPMLRNLCCKNVTSILLTIFSFLLSFSIAILTYELLTSVFALSALLSSDGLGFGVLLELLVCIILGSALGLALGLSLGLTKWNFSLQIFSLASGQAGVLLFSLVVTIAFLAGSLTEGGVSALIAICAMLAIQYIIALVLESTRFGLRAALLKFRTKVELIDVVEAVWAFVFAIIISFILVGNFSSDPGLFIIILMPLLVCCSAIFLGLGLAYVFKKS